MEPQTVSEKGFTIEELFAFLKPQGMYPVEIDFGDGSGRRLREIPEQSNELVRTGDEEKSQGTS